MTVHTPKIGLPVAVPPALRVWIPTLLWIAVACVAFGLAFQHESCRQLAGCLEESVEARQLLLPADD